MHKLLKLSALTLLIPVLAGCKKPSFSSKGSERSFTTFASKFYDAVESNSFLSGSKVRSCTLKSDYYSKTSTSVKHGLKTKQKSTSINKEEYTVKFNKIKSLLSIKGKEEEKIKSKGPSGKNVEKDLLKVDQLYQEGKELLKVDKKTKTYTEIYTPDVDETLQELVLSLMTSKIGQYFDNVSDDQDYVYYVNKDVFTIVYELDKKKSDDNSGPYETIKNKDKMTIQFDLSNTNPKIKYYRETEQTIKLTDDVMGYVKGDVASTSSIVSFSGSAKFNTPSISKSDLIGYEKVDSQDYLK